MAAMYLSPTTPRWQPASEQDLQAALDAGLLEETKYLELKRELGSSKAANKELARDLAQFAIDGGLLIVGVDEHKDDPSSPFTLTPVTLAGLPERVEQIAISLPDPPLPVTCTTIPSAADPARGYLLVSIPSSGAAPHMVEGVYYGRGDKTRHRLSDSRVLELHQRRADREAIAAGLLDTYIERDPVPSEVRRQAHLFLIAAPLSARPEMLLDVIEGGDWHATLDKIAASARTIRDDAFAPNLSSVGSFARRHGGVAMTTYGLTANRQLADANHEDFVELELMEDGTVHLMTTRLSDGLQGDDTQMIFADMIPVFTRQLIELARGVSDHTGYLGPWLLGHAATGIAGLSAYIHQFRSAGPSLPRDLNRYSKTVTASVAELSQTPGELTRRLTGQLLRSLGQADQLSNYLKD